MRTHFGRYVFAFAAIWGGLVGIWWRKFTVWQQITAFGNVPHQDTLACIAFSIELAGGVMLLLPRSVRAGSIALGAIYALFALLWIPMILATPLIYDRWGNLFEQLSLFSGAALLYATAIGSARLARAAYYGFGVCVVSFTLEQAIYLQGTAGFVPKWIPPGQMFWAVATTAAFALAAIALLTGFQARLASRLTTAMIVGFGVLIWIPAPFGDPHALTNWAGIAENFGICGSAWIIADYLRA